MYIQRHAEGHGEGTCQYVRLDTGRRAKTSRENYNARKIDRRHELRHFRRSYSQSRRPRKKAGLFSKIIPRPYL